MQSANDLVKEEEYTHAHEQRRVSENFDFENLRLMVEGFPVCYEMQRLTI